MTAKEKVLECKWCGCSLPYGMMATCFESPNGLCEPKDAAESLPAASEQELMPCLNVGCGKELNHDGDCDYEYYGPVAPVEAKEKERCEHGVWLADYCYKCAEPKPTPSKMSTYTGIDILGNPVFEPKPTPEPKFQKVYCSQCGGEFGPRSSGYSDCEDHQNPLTDRDNYLIEEGLRAYKEGDSMRCGKSETVGWTCKRKLSHSGPCAPQPDSSEHIFESHMENSIYPPQPDSSSIPDEQNIAKKLMMELFEWLVVNFDLTETIQIGETPVKAAIRIIEAQREEIRNLRDSSSISAEPKQLVSEEMVFHLTHDDVNSVADMATELQQWRKWAAAKGLK